MPLSEHEQRLLEQIEQGLYAEDPKFASSVRRARGHTSGRRRVLIGIAGAVVGLCVVMLALLTKVTPIGVVGFVLIVGSCAYALGVTRGKGIPNGPIGLVDSGGKTTPHRPAGMKSRMEDRLRRRFDEE